MNCPDCPNWNKDLKTCKLNPDVKRDKNMGCDICPVCAKEKLIKVADYFDDGTKAEMYCCPMCEFEAFI